MRRILIVDDDRAFLTLLTEFVQTNFPELDLVCRDNPIQALADIEADLGLLLLDLEMPGMDGSKLLNYAIEKGLSRNRIIILSSHEADYLHQKFPMGECLAVLNKHEIRQREVLNMIFRALQRKGRQQEDPEESR